MCVFCKRWCLVTNPDLPFKKCRRTVCSPPPAKNNRFNKGTLFVLNVNHYPAVTYLKWQVPRHGRMYLFMCVDGALSSTQVCLLRNIFYGVLFLGYFYGVCTSYCFYVPLPVDWQTFEPSSRQLTQQRNTVHWTQLPTQSGWFNVIKTKKYK